MNDHEQRSADALTEPAVKLAASWLDRSAGGGSRADRKAAAQLEQIVSDPDAVRFVMGFVDRVVRPDEHRVAAAQLRSLVGNQRLPQFLSPVDRLLLRAGASLSAALPGVVMPLARRRMRAIVGHLVAPAEADRLGDHLANQEAEGFALNVNLLGEAVLGEGEAERRFNELKELLGQPSVDYVSVKISAVASQLNHFAHHDSLRRVTERLDELFAAAAVVEPATFINLDMEEYHDLDLTLAAFMEVLDRPELEAIDAGIVLQAYLPDAFDALQRLTEWANRRHDRGGGTVKVRLVKGANLAMERVDAAIHGWPQAPFDTKVEADANYKRCIDWLVDQDRMRGVRLGLASHNLFDIAWTRLLSVDRGVADRVQFEMLQGMAPAQAEVMAADVTENRLLMYTPAVRNENFDVAISYLFRRLEENAADENFMKHLFRLAEDREAFDAQAQIFRDAMKLRTELPTGPRRDQDRTDQTPHAAYRVGAPFRNEPDTDPILAANRPWIEAVAAAPARAVQTPMTTDTAAIQAVVDTAREAGAIHRSGSPTDRQLMLHRVGDELDRRRGELITTMIHEANKTFREADGEVSEAIDFARYYGDQALALSRHTGLRFEPLGVMAIIPPWNFPVAIPTGGMMAALAAGNSVVVKPAPETPRCAEIVAEAAWAAGVSRELLQFVRTPDNEVGQCLVMAADGVILTGSAETAELFRSWKPELRLFAETSGKNALIVSQNADIDLAVADLVQSAFSHSGQKCSAASLAIVIGDTYESQRFRRQLADAVESLSVGPATRIESDLAPLISEPNDRLARALTTLESGEMWLVEPKLRNRDLNLWSPGVRLGVRPGSWFQQTECFGPVLGVMQAADLDEAINIQNSTDFGLTGGIHTLDPDEIASWLERVEVGNAYVNRAITGAIVQRQPFGGWKRSSVGPSAKAGGPNYLEQLGTWHHTKGGPVRSSDAGAPQRPEDDYQASWDTHFAKPHDPTGLFCEANVFRYVPLSRILVRVEAEASDVALQLVRKAAAIAGVALVESHAATETQSQLADRLPDLMVDRIRLVGGEPTPALRAAAAAAHLHLADGEVTPVGRIELQHYLREQAISETLHRFGNLTMTRNPRRTKTDDR